MYSKERAQQITKNDVRFISAGIHENVQLKSARLAESPTGNKFLEIVFEKDGATLTQTEWKPTKFEDMDEAALQKKEDTQFSRMMQILLCFYKDEQLIFNGSTFEEFATEVVNYLNNADKSKLVRVKIVYNSKGYTTLPSYAKYTFIEPMTLPEGMTSAIVKLGIDNFEKPIVADVETPVDTLDSVIKNETTSFNTGNLNDLPF